MKKYIIAVVAKLNLGQDTSSKILQNPRFKMAGPSEMSRAVGTSCGAAVSVLQCPKVSWHTLWESLNFREKCHEGLLLGIRGLSKSTRAHKKAAPMHYHYNCCRDAC